MVKFFEDCGEMVGLRWLTHKDSGQFKGCGYAEFATTEAADQAILKDGQMLLGRYDTQVIHAFEYSHRLQTHSFGLGLSQQ